MGALGFGGLLSMAGGKVAAGGGGATTIADIKQGANAYVIPGNNTWVKVAPVGELDISLNLPGARYCVIIWTAYRVSWTVATQEEHFDVAVDGVRVGDVTDGLQGRIWPSGPTLSELDLVHVVLLPAGVHTFSPYAKALGPGNFTIDMFTAITFTPRGIFSVLALP